MLARTGRAASAFQRSGLLDWVPCQVWNLLPPTMIAGFALVWLLRDLARAHD